MAFSGNGPVEEWMEAMGEEDGGLLKKEMTLNDTEGELVIEKDFRLDL